MIDEVVKAFRVKTSTLNQQIALLGRVQQRGESITGFSVQLKKMAEFADWGKLGEVINALFVKGLADKQIAEKLFMDSKVDDMDPGEIMRFCERLERIKSEQKKQPATTTTTLYTKEADGLKEKEKVAKLEAEVAKLSAYKARKEGKDKKPDRKAEKKDWKKDRKCFNCDRPGHFAAECTQPKKAQNNHVVVNVCASDVHEEEFGSVAALLWKVKGKLCVQTVQTGKATYETDGALLDTGSQVNILLVKYIYIPYLLVYQTDCIFLHSCSQFTSGMQV